MCGSYQMTRKDILVKTVIQKHQEFTRTEYVPLYFFHYSFKNECLK